MENATKIQADKNTDRAGFEKAYAETYRTAWFAGYWRDNHDGTCTWVYITQDVQQSWVMWQKCREGAAK